MLGPRSRSEIDFLEKISNKKDAETGEAHAHSFRKKIYKDLKFMKDGIDAAFGPLPPGFTSPPSDIFMMLYKLKQDVAKLSDFISTLSQ